MINDFVLDQSQDHSYGNTWTTIRCLKASHSREHANFPASCRTRARLLTGITLHVSLPVPNHTPHKPKTVMTNTRLYKGEHASPSRYTSLSTTLLTHSLSVGVLTWLQAPFVPPRRLIATVLETVTDSLEHSLPPLRGHTIWR